MVKIKVKGVDITEFLNDWDKKVYVLNVELKKINLKQKKEQVISRKKEGLTFRAHK